MLDQAKINLNASKSINLRDYGFTESDFEAINKIKLEKKMDDYIPARIIESQRDRYKVICEHPAHGCMETAFTENHSAYLRQKKAQYKSIAMFTRTQGNRVKKKLF